MKKVFLLVPLLMMSNMIWAQSGTCGDNVKWNYTSGTLTISGTGPMDDYKSSTSVPWYSYSSKNDYTQYITKVVIKDGVTRIGDYAFGRCKELWSVNIANTVTSIGNNAFDGCSQLQSITIPNSVTSIGNNAFGGCKSLSSIEVVSENPIYDSRDNCNAIIETASNTLIRGCKNTVVPKSVTSIGTFAFYYCNGLTSIEIPKSVTSIGESAFRCCYDLTSITLNEGLTSIGKEAFYDCRALVSISIPKSVNSIGNRVFYNCWGLTSITISDGVETVGEYAFESCSGLKSVTIGNSVKSIGNAAFWHCSALTSITIGNSVSKFDRSIFSGCNIMKSIIVDPGNPIFDSRDNCNAIIESVTNTLIFGCTGLTSITIPDGVKKIGEYAFQKCTGLTSVTIPDGVESIGDYAFQGCTGLTSITIPDGVEIIGDYAFSGCSGLKSVTIGNSVKSIGKYAFNECSGFNSVTIPNSVMSIGDYGFYNCKNLSSVTIENPNTHKGNNAFTGTPWNDQTEVYDYVIYKGTVVCGHVLTEPRSIVLREGTTEIANGAFEDCGRINSITIPGSVKTIGQSAFSGCKYLTSIIIPEGVEIIGDYAFSNCTGLNTISIPNSVTSIGDGAFNSCTGLTSIIIPKSVTKIGNSVFSWCSGLTSIKVDSENTYYDSRDNCNAIIETVSNTFLRGCMNSVIPNSVTCIGNHAFSGYTNLTSIIIPNSVTNIGSNVFSGCSNLTSVTIPNSVTYVGKDAFYWEKDTENWTYQFYVPWYKNLPDGLVYIGKVAYAYKGSMPDNTSIVIKEGTKEIAERAFSNCTALTSITIPNTVTNIRDYALSGCSGFASVTIPNSVKEIEDYVFYGCTGLTSVTISNGVTSIGYHAFEKCTSLTSITIPNSVTSIQGWAFQNCSNLSSVTIENPNTSIGYMAFDGTKWYGQSEAFDHVIYKGSVACGYEETMPVGTSIVLREGTTEIASSAFSGCENMVSITIPNSVKSIGYSSFKDCSNLTSIIIPNSLTSIGNGAFSGCSSLKTVTLHCSKIGTWFASNSSITEIIIGKEVTSIAAGAFNGCSGLTTVTFHCPTIESWFADNTSINEVIIGEEVNNIGNYAFKGCTGLTSVNIPNSVKSIGSLVFMGCNNLSSLVIPESVTDIGSRAFACCDGLTTVSIPSSMTKIKEHTFNGCKNLTSVAFPKSITSIGDYTFLNCNSLEYILLKSMTPPSISSSSIGNSQFIIVQNDALKTYQTTDIWKDLKYISYETTPIFLRVDKENLKGTSCHFKYYPIDEAHNYGEKDNGEECIVYGLNPEASQSGVSVEWKMKDGNYGTAILDVFTTELTLDTQDSKTLSETKGRLIANTTEDDDMTHYGFEWRRYDAPDGRPSNKVSAPLYNGTIVGTLNNLNPDVDYKYRPYYKSDDGTMFYGEWMWLYTGDASVFFEPEVYTKDASDITKVSALLAGIWVEGTDDFTEKGFEYWTVSGSKTRTVGSDVKTVIVTGNKLTSIIDGLKSGTEYGYRSYAKTASGTTYGEEKTFKTIPIMGDANGDGELNGTDRNYIARHIMGDTPDDFDEEAANLNGDEKIDAVDLVLLNNLLKEQ